MQKNKEQHYSEAVRGTMAVRNGQLEGAPQGARPLRSFEPKWLEPKWLRIYFLLIYVYIYIYILYVYDSCAWTPNSIRDNLWDHS